MTPHTAPSRARRWALFCRVVDNFGDAGVCWRLATGLAARGEHVRLVIDDAAPLAWMAPGGIGGTAGVEVQAWPGSADAAEVVIEAFGCDPPPAFVDAMARQPVPPVWINLEYLSAEDWVERAHGLPSPQRNGLTKWFLFPGFSKRTLGLLREPGLLETRATFDGPAWLAARGWAPAAGERTVLLFAYPNEALPRLLADLATAPTQPTQLLVPPGAVQAAVAAMPLPDGLRLTPLPFVPQPDFDRLLWSADLAFVRGEDSLVRAIWSGTPFVWQAYPQHDGAQHAKVEALLAVLAPPALAPGVAAEVAAVWRAWNAAPGAAWAAPPARLAAWHAAFAAARDRLALQTDLVTQLLGFVSARVSPA